MDGNFPFLPHFQEPTDQVDKLFSFPIRKVVIQTETKSLQGATRNEIC